MNTLEPVVLARQRVVPVAPPFWERSRLQWYLGDPGDPVRLVEEFLAEHGLGLGGPKTGAAAGAALLLSAAAGAVSVGAAAGTPSPAPAVPDVVAIVYDRQPPTGPADRGGAWRLEPWQESWTAAEHEAAVTAVRQAISRGDVYQVNLVGHASARYSGDPQPALSRVAALADARYGRVLSGPGWAVACASPETLLAVAGGRVVTRPIKGTRPATVSGRAELLNSVKERAEHVMIVDLERNDLARVAVTGTVRVDELYSIRRWCDLWQAESTISAELLDGVGLADLLRALWPGGSVTGAPKLAALDVIAGLEPVGRGPSMGAIGWIDPSGVDLGLTIRTVAVDADRVHVWAGGGITWGSEPAAEVAEARAKAAPLRAALAR